MRPPGGRAPISPNTTSPSALRYHSMWVNPSRNPSAFSDGGAERPAGLQIGHVQVAQRHGDRADPLVHLDDQRARAVPADVLEQHLAAGADGVVGELLAVDELLDADLRHVPEHRQDGVEVGGRVGPVGVRRAGAGDRLDDEREAEALRRGPDARDRVGALRAPACAGPPRRAAASSAPCPGTARSAPRSARAGRAPRAAARRGSCTAPTGTPPGRCARAGPARARSRRPRPRRPASRPGCSAPARPARAGQRRRRLVAHADDRRPGAGEPAGEERHLGRVAGRDHEDVHRGQPSSTRTVVTSRRSASATTAVSGCRTIT